MAKRQEHRRERRRGRSVFDRIGGRFQRRRWVPAGLTLGGGDELFANSIDMEQAASRAGRVHARLGDRPYPGRRWALEQRPARRAGLSHALRPRPMLGAAHGGAAGLFGMTPGDMSDEGPHRRGPAYGRARRGRRRPFVPATRAAMDVADNMPALMGRQRLEDGTTVQAKFGQERAIPRR